MSLIEDIRADQLAARKEKAVLRATELTTLLGELGRDGGNVEITDEKVVTTVKKFIKGESETLECARKAGNLEAMDASLAKLAILESYLPRQMTKEQIKGAILSNFRTRPFVKGQLMSWMKGNYAGHYDGRDAAAAVDELIKAETA